ncbi:MAG: hypothetical protein JEZ11_07820 [Desulfobacterales bacterium]|nr:hypothetical protein [Desulfobacterales bacterium]
MNRRHTQIIADPLRQKAYLYASKASPHKMPGRRKSLLAVDLTANKFASLRE